MKQEIIEKLHNICKVIPLNQHARAKESSQYKCLRCDGIFVNTASSLLQRNKIYGSTGCPKCVADDKLFTIRSLNKEKLEATFILPNNFIDKKYKDYVKVINKTCGHEFETTVDNLLSGGVLCPICEIERRNNINKIMTAPKKEYFTHDQFLSLLQTNNIKLQRNIKVSDGFVYSGMLSPLQFECDNGHTWVTRAVSVIHANSGCPYCAKNNYSKVSIKWLNSISSDILHAENGGEQRLKGKSGKKYYVDGFDPKTNTIYEFHGSAYHGDPKIYKPDDTPHPFKKNLTASKLYENTKNKENDLIAAGYNLVVMWESEYNLI